MINIFDLENNNGDTSFSNSNTPLQSDIALFQGALGGHGSSAPSKSFSNAARQANSDLVKEAENTMERRVTDAKNQMILQSTATAAKKVTETAEKIKF